MRETFFHDRVVNPSDALEDPLPDPLLVYENDPARVRSITARE